MIRYLSFKALLCLTYATSWSQCIISKDADGQLVTTCDVYRSSDPTIIAPGHKKVVYLGTPYLTFPTWVKGTIQLDQGGQVMACMLAYDLVTNTLQCQFEGSPTVNDVTPYTFTIQGMTFIRQLNSVLGVDYQLYTTLLNTGQTTLAKRISSQLVMRSIANGYQKNSPFQGAYQPKITYYIRKGQAQPQPTDLSRKSILSILYEQSPALAQKLPNRPLTPQEVIQVLNEYDSLMTLANRQKPPLSTDPVFQQGLRNFITYPSQAWRERVYGRVYVGFDITESGQLVDITTLSPANVGFGLDEAVKQALRKLAKLSPDYKGRYCLPVAYTYTNRVEKEVTHFPVNVLPDERLGRRTLLAEVVVPVEVSKPVGTSREVWGYYP